MEQVLVHAAELEQRDAHVAAGLARVLPVGCISRGQEGHDLAEYGELKAAGCVAVSDDGKPVVSSALMRRALERQAHLLVPLDRRGRRRPQRPGRRRPL